MNYEAFRRMIYNNIYKVREAKIESRGDLGNWLKRNIREIKVKHMKITE